MEKGKTQVNGKRYINTVAVSAGLLPYLEGCKLINFNEVISTDYHGIMLDININEYFGVSTSKFYSRTYERLDYKRRSQREKFIKKGEDLVQQIGLEKLIDELENEPEGSGNYKVECVDKEFTYIFQRAASYAVGVNRGIHHTERKV